MVAAVSKLMRVQDLVLVAQKVRVISRFRNTIGLRGRMSTRLQPNHPTDDAAGIAASIFDGLLYGNGDAVIGINPASDSVGGICELLHMLDAVIQRYDIPTQACVLTHVTTSIAAIERGAPSVAIGHYASALFSLGLLDDLPRVAADDELGRRLQDLGLPKRAHLPKTRKGSRDA